MVGDITLTYCGFEKIKRKRMADSGGIGSNPGDDDSDVRSFVCERTRR